MFVNTVSFISHIFKHSALYLHFLEIKINIFWTASLERGLCLMTN